MTEHATAPKRTTTRTKGPNLRLVPDPKTLSAKQAKDLAAATARYEKAKAALDKAKTALDKIHDRLRPRLPSGEATVIGGFSVKRTSYSFDTFSLKDYKLAGGKVTAKMAPHVKAQRGEKWTVKPVK